MIDEAKVIVTSNRVSVFKNNKGVSPTSIPVEDVEAWLDANPDKRIDHNDLMPTRKIESNLRSFMVRHPERTFTKPSEIKEACENAKREHQKALNALKTLNEVSTGRTCIKCSEVKPLDDVHFYRNASKNFAGQCKECAKKYTKAYKLKKLSEKEKPQSVVAD